MLTLKGQICRIVRDVRGIAAVEFAFLAPVMLLLFIAGGEMAQAIMTARNTESLARALSDLTSQEPTASQTASTPPPSDAITQTTVEQILAASSAIMTNAKLAPLQMTITAVDIVNNPSTNQCCVFKVRWSYTQNGTLRNPTCNSTNYLTPVPSSTAPALTNIPNALMPSGSQLNGSGGIITPEAVIVADVNYTYQPPLFGSLVSFQPSMSATQFMLPRQAGQVILRNAGGTTGTLPSYTDPTSGSSQTGVICY